MEESDTDTEQSEVEPPAPWKFDEPPEAWQSFEGHEPVDVANKVLEMLAEVSKLPLPALDLHARAIDFIYYSNRFENAGGSLKQTRAWLRRATPSLWTSLAETRANVQALLLLQEGSYVSTAVLIKRREILQHWLAFMTMRTCGLELWSVEGIKALHREMMTGLEATGLFQPSISGEFRTRSTVGEEFYSGGHSEPEMIADDMAAFVACVRHQLEISLPSGRTPRLLQIVAFVLGTLICIRPFGNGNGKLARLLASHVLLLHGVLVPLPMVTLRANRLDGEYLFLTIEAAQYRPNHYEQSRAATCLSALLADELSDILGRP